MKILVTGGAGFIGSNLVNKLISQNHQVTIIDNLSTGKRENLNLKAEFYELDICDFEKISPLFSGIDGVFHLAAIPRVPVSVKDPVNTSKSNILGTISVFKAAKDNNVKRVIFASSSSIYGNQKELPLKETMIPNPLSPYALQKFVGEKFARMFVDLYKLPIICLRFFNVYGPGINPESEYSLVLGRFLKLKSQGKPLTIFGDGEQSRGFCYIDDIVDGNIKAMESDKLKGGEIINLGNSNSNSINDLARLIGGEIQYFDPRVGDILHTKADASLAKELLGWESKVSFEQGIKNTIEWFNKL